MKINKQNIRVGNMLSCTSFDGWVTVVDLSDFARVKRVDGGDEVNVHWEYLRPVEISEESLNKLCYSHDIFGDMWTEILKRSNGDFEFTIADYGYVLSELKWRGDWTMGIEYYDPPNYEDEGVVFPFLGEGLKYIHQLQNLFYSLQNKELKVKDR